MGVLAQDGNPDSSGEIVVHMGHLVGEHLHIVSAQSHVVGYVVVAGVAPVP